MLYGMFMICTGTLVITLTCRLCVQIPHVGGRLIETGDEEFLKLPFKDRACSVVCQFVLFISPS